jgi:hypothetical protein
MNAFVGKAAVVTGAGLDRTSAGAPPARAERSSLSDGDEAGPAVNGDATFGIKPTSPWPELGFQASEGKICDCGGKQADYVRDAAGREERPGAPGRPPRNRI